MDGGQPQLWQLVVLPTFAEVGTRQRHRTHIALLLGIWSDGTSTTRYQRESFFSFYLRAPVFFARLVWGSEQLFTACQVISSAVLAKGRTERSGTPYESQRGARNKQVSGLAYRSEKRIAIGRHCGSNWTVPSAGMESQQATTRAESKRSGRTPQLDALTRGRPGRGGGAWPRYLGTRARQVQYLARSGQGGAGCPRTHTHEHRDGALCALWPKGTLSKFSRPPVGRGS